MQPIISRSEWGARAPKNPPTAMPKLARINWYIHWLGVGYPASMSDDQIMQSVQRYHQGTKGWNDIAYSFAIGRNGRAYEGRGFGIQGAHTNHHNSDGMGIVFLIGEGERPTLDMIHAATDVIEAGRKLGYGGTQITVHPHMDVEPPGYTECAGPDLTAWARGYNHARDYLSAPTAKETTMDPRKVVEQMYADILPGHEDETGIAFWTGKLARREMDQAGLLQHFTAVRLGAVQAEVDALKRAVAGATPLGDIEKARSDFFSELRAWAAALPQA